MLPWRSEPLIVGRSDDVARRQELRAAFEEERLLFRVGDERRGAVRGNAYRAVRVRDDLAAIGRWCAVRHEDDPANGCRVTVVASRLVQHSVCRRPGLKALDDLTADDRAGGPVGKRRRRRVERSRCIRSRASDKDRPTRNRRHDERHDHDRDDQQPAPPAFRLLAAVDRRQVIVGHGSNLSPAPHGITPFSAGCAFAGFGWWVATGSQELANVAYLRHVRTIRTLRVRWPSFASHWPGPSSLALDGARPGCAARRSRLRRSYTVGTTAHPAQIPREVVGGSRGYPGIPASNCNERPALVVNPTAWHERLIVLTTCTWHGLPHAHDLLYT
jgi:hypothetical protein